MRLNSRWLIGLLLIVLMAGCAQQTSTPGSEDISECPAATTGTQAFVANNMGYCFLYPAGFQPIEPEGVPTTIVTVIVGPDYSGKIGTEPLRATLVIDVTQLVNGQSAAQVADDLAAQFPDAHITRSNLMLGGVSAVQLEGLPRQGTSQEAVAVRGDWLYHLVLMPVGVENAALQDDLERLWQTVVDTFVFFDANR